jgi:integrase
LIVGICVGIVVGIVGTSGRAMATNRLSDITARSAKAKPAPYKLSDGGGLHLLVTPAGGRLWRLAYRYGGKQKTLALGTYPLVSLAEARTARDGAKRHLLEGRDPSVAKQIRGDVNAPRERATFEAVAKAWFKAREKRWVPAFAKRIWSRVEGDLIVAFGQTPIDEVDHSDVLSALKRIERRGSIEMAHRVKSYARDIFRFARAAKLISGDPTQDLEYLLSSRPPTKGRAALEQRDLPEFLEKLRSYDGDERTRLALTLTLLTFVRTQEVRFARWTEFDDLQGPEPLWRVPRGNMKMRVRHLVPLSSQAAYVIGRLRQHSDSGEYLLGAQTISGVISQNTMIYALYRLGYHSRATVHGIRSTASTILNEQGFNRDWIERQLAHNERDQVRAAYNAAEWMPERRRMMQWWADYLVGQGLDV